MSCPADVDSAAHLAPDRASEPDYAYKPEIAYERDGNVRAEQSYHRKLDLICALGVSGCMVGFMVVLALPFFRSASPIPAGHAGNVVQVQILPSTGQTATQSPAMPQQRSPEIKTAAHGMAATPTPPVTNQVSATLPPSAAANPGATAQFAADSAMDVIASSQRAAQRSVTAAFQAALYDRIGQYEIYPKEALQQQLQGMVVVTFVMDRNGTVLKVSVKRTSGEIILDKAAAESILMAQPLPSIPSQLPGHLTVELPITFSTSNLQSGNLQPGQSGDP